MIYYKIRNKRTGLYHKGGSYNVWNKSGKTWDTLGKLRAMLTMTLNNEYRSSDISDWEVIEFEVTEKAVKQVHEVIDPKKLMKFLKEI